MAVSIEIGGGDGDGGLARMWWRRCGRLRVGRRFAGISIWVAAATAAEVVTSGEEGWTAGTAVYYSAGGEGGGRRWAEVGWWWRGRRVAVGCDG